MSKKPSTDFETYKEIMDDLLKPISPDGLDYDTLKRLYESKMVYLENLRIKCFREVNMNKNTHFRHQDYELIVRAAVETKAQLRSVVISAISDRLSTIKSA